MSIVEIEAKCYRESLKHGRELVLKELESRDAELASERDRKRYRHKGYGRTCIKTVMGEVEFSRRRYYDTEEDRFVYLLDEELGMREYGKISPITATAAVKAASGSTFREAAREVSDLTGLSISHQTVWDLTQRAGEKLRAMEGVIPEEIPKKTKILYEEADGIWLHLQGADRKKYGPGKEMKVAIAYDGIRQDGKRRICDGKTACAGIMEINSFRAKAENTVRNVYDTAEIDARILNGDGAGWIFKRDDQTVKQLDIFHRNKALRENISDNRLVKLIQKKLYEKDVRGALDLIDAYRNSLPDGDEKDKAEALFGYYDNHKDILLNYNRRGLKLPPVNEGLQPAKLGAMESNVFSLIGNRMKGHRKCWSIEGANNMAEILCLKHTGRLDRALKEIDLPIGIWDRCEDYENILSSAEVPETIGKGYNGYKKADLTHLSSIKYSAIRRLADN